MKASHAESRKVAGGVEGGGRDILNALPEMTLPAFVRNAAVYFPHGKQAKFSLIIRSRKTRLNGAPFTRLMRLVPGLEAQK